MIIYISLKLVLKCTVVCCANGVACSTLCVKDICRTFMSEIWKHIIMICSDFIPILLEFYHCTGKRLQGAVSGIQAS